MKPLIEMSTRQLKEEAVGLYESIFKAECVGALDLIRYEKILGELENRGIRAVENGGLQLWEKR